MRFALATVIAGVMLSLPSAAAAEVLFDHIDATSPESTTSQDFEASFDSFDALAADDFQVPSGEAWQLDQALIRGNNFGASTTSTVNVTIFADADGIPGAVVFSGQIQAPGYPDFTLPLGTVPALTSGSYWLGVQAVLNGVSFMNPQQWFWAENDEQFGSRAVFRNPGGGHTASCPSFGVRSTCLPSHPSPDESFSLSGTRKDIAPPQTTIDKAPSKLKPKAGKKTARAKFAFSSNESGSAFKCRIDKAAFKACASPFKAKLKKGKHTFEAVATDAAGNVDATPAKARVKVVM